VAARGRHAFEPGCSIGVLTELLTARCSHVIATDVVPEALDTAMRRLERAGVADRVSLRSLSIDDEWPDGDVDLVVLSKVAYYLSAERLSLVLDREIVRLAFGATVVAARGELRRRGRCDVGARSAQRGIGFRCVRGGRLTAAIADSSAPATGSPPSGSQRRRMRSTSTPAMTTQFTSRREHVTLT
jgi:hypothetical protein